MGDNMMATVYAMTLQGLTNDELAAFNNAIQTWGRIQPLNKAYAHALELEIIKPDGRPHDLEAMQTASSYEVNRRVKLGLFV